jgi:hypothetical protein
MISRGTPGKRLVLDWHWATGMARGALDSEPKVVAAPRD